MLIELPCGILHDGLVYDKVNVKELTGKQQNYLVDMDLVANNLGHVTKLLEDLTSDYQTSEGLPLNMTSKEAIWKLPTEDIEFILLKIRELTFGAVMALPVSCPWCGHQQTKKLELDKLSVTPLPDKKIRTRIIELPKSKLTAEVKLLYIKDLFDLYKILKENTHALYTGSLCLSISKLGEKTNVTQQDLDSLPATDLQLMEDAFSTLRGSIDTNIIHDCENCHKEFNAPLPVMDPSFFVRSLTPSI